MAATEGNRFPAWAQQAQLRFVSGDCFRCPNCNSTDVKKVSLAYQEGLFCTVACKARTRYVAKVLPSGELWKQRGINPGADTNPPEDQEDAVERLTDPCRAIYPFAFCNSRRLFSPTALSNQPLRRIPEEENKKIRRTLTLHLQSVIPYAQDQGWHRP
jgi:hypothetical protein